MHLCLLRSSPALCLHWDESHTLHAPIKPTAPAFPGPRQPISSLPSAWDHVISSGQSAASLWRVTSLTSCFPPAAELHFLLRVFVLKWRLTARPSRLAPDPTRRCWHALKRRPGWFWMLRAPTGPFSQWPWCTLEVRRLSYCVCVGRERRGRLLCHDLWPPLRSRRIWAAWETLEMASNVFGLHSQQAAYLDCIFRRLCNIFGRNNPCILHASDARNCSSKHSMHVARVNGEKNSVYSALVKEEGVCLTSLPSP